MKMKTIWNWGVGLGLGAAAVAGGAETNAPAVTAKAAGAPKIKFEKTLYDFGTTSVVQSVSGKFVFENVGDAELEITKVTPGCGCTSTGVKPASQKLAPGEKGEIGFTLTVGSGAGLMRKHILVACNDPQTPTVNLNLQVKMEKILNVPAHLSFRELALRKETNFPLVVKRMDGKPFQLTQVSSSDPLVTARLDEESLGTGTVARVLVNVKGGNNVRSLSSILNIQIAGVAGTAASVTIMGQLIGDLRVVPQQVIWGVGDPASWPGPKAEVTTKRIIRLTSANPETVFQVLKATSSLTNVTATVVPEEDGKVYRVALRLTGLTSSSQQGTITIDTNLPENSKVSVPVHVFTGQGNMRSRLERPKK